MTRTCYHTCLEVGVLDSPAKNVRINQCETRLEFVKKGFDADFSMGLTGKGVMTRRRSLVCQHAGARSFSENRQDEAAGHFSSSNCQAICICAHSLQHLLSLCPLQVSQGVGFCSLPPFRFLLPDCMIHLHLLLMGPSKSIFNIKTFNGSDDVSSPLPFSDFPSLSECIFILQKELAKGFFFLKEGLSV